MKRFISIILSLITVLSLCSCSNESTQESLQEQLSSEAESDFVDIFMPRYFMDDDEYAFWSKTASEPLDTSIYQNILVEEDMITLTITKEAYTKMFSIEGFTNEIVKLLSDYSAFKSLTFSNDFLSAYVYVDKSLYMSSNNSEIIKTVYSSLSERNAYSGVFEPTITINVYDFNSSNLIHSLTHKRPAERIIETTAKDLVTAFTKDEESAMAEYGNKYVLATGIVQAVELDTNGMPGYVLLKPHSGESVCWLQCNLNESAYKRASQLKEGEEATIVGICTEQFLHIQIDECVVF